MRRNIRCNPVNSRPKPAVCIVCRKKICTFANPKSSGMSEIVNVSFEDFINQLPASGLFEENLFVTKIICPQAGQRLMSPVRLNAVLLFFCKNGELSISIDYQEYSLNKNKALWISNLHIIDSIIISEDLEGYAIIMSQQIAKTIFNEIREINSFIGDDHRIPSPMAELDDAEMQYLSEVVERIIKIQGDTSHVFQSHIIRNEVSNLFFEILNIRIKRNKNQTSLDKSGYKEEVARKFILLLLEKTGLTVEHLNENIL
jgi:hypothetical protein